MSEDIIKVITHSKKHRDITLASVIHLEENIADFEGKLDLTEGKRVILNLIANKLQMYDAKFHKYHYKLVGCINDSGRFKVQQKILDDYDRRMMDFFMWIKNLQFRA